MIVPATVAETLKPEHLSAIEAALAPAVERRASVVVEVEVEVVGEGTFTIRYENRHLTAKKGFAKAAALSVKLGKGSWNLLRDELQAAVDGFPHAPLLRERSEHFRETTTTKDGDTAITAVHKIPEGLAVVFDIKGEGVMTVARGSVDEATREMKIGLVGSEVRGLLAGAALTSVKPSVGGDRSVGTSILAALGPTMRQLKLQ